MRRICTIDELRRLGITETVRRRNWRRIEIGVYGEGLDRVTVLDRAVGAVIATDGVASGIVAATLLDLDSPVPKWPDVSLGRTANGRRRRARRRNLPDERIVVIEDVAGRDVRCTDGLQTLVDAAAEVDDLVWEQLLESVLRKKLATLLAIEAAVVEMGRARTPGTKRARRVLALRPPGAPPTESLLETLMVQLIRRLTGLPEPQRQVEIYDRYGNFVARVDLAWPELGIFIELDGQGHKDQPVYDAFRETAVVIATGWLVGRFTWNQVVYNARITARQLEDLHGQARRRPLPA